MSRNETDRWNKCESKYKWTGSDAEAQAWGEAKRLMRASLRQGIVHRQTVYSCKYADPSEPHFHVGRRQRPYICGTHALVGPSAIAAELHLKWTEEDETEAQLYLAAAEAGEDILDHYWKHLKGGPKWSPQTKEARSRPSTVKKVWVRGRVSGRSS